MTCPLFIRCLANCTANWLNPRTRARFNTMWCNDNVESRIIVRAQELGTDLVGIASLEAVLTSSPNVVAEVDGVRASTHNELSASSLTRGFARYRPEASVIVLALAHPASQPELDWFSSSENTRGNSQLIGITRALAKWLKESEDIPAQPLHYYVEKGGIYLKDAAVQCGLGCIGRNNLLVTPEFGPRVRLRALVAEAKLETTRPIDFDPCISCPEFCRQACPQDAFYSKPLSTSATAASRFPGRDGSYRRASCMTQMELDWTTSAYPPVEDNPADMEEESIGTAGAYVVKHCRRCEFACPVGNSRG